MDRAIRLLGLCAKTHAALVQRIQEDRRITVL